MYILFVVFCTFKKVVLLRAYRTMFNQRRIEKNVLGEPIGHRDKSEHIKNPDLEISLQRNYKAYRKTLKILAKI